MCELLFNIFMISSFEVNSLLFDSKYTLEISKCIVMVLSALTLEKLVTYWAKADTEMVSTLIFRQIALLMEIQLPISNSTASYQKNM